jgi:hypothetical protein
VQQFIYINVADTVKVKIRTTAVIFNIQTWNDNEFYDLRILLSNNLNGKESYLILTTLDRYNIRALQRGSLAIKQVYST